MKHLTVPEQRWEDLMSIIKFLYLLPPEIREPLERLSGFTLSLMSDTERKSLATFVQSKTPYALQDIWSAALLVFATGLKIEASGD